VEADARLRGEVHSYSIYLQYLCDTCGENCRNCCAEDTKYLQHLVEVDARLREGGPRILFLYMILGTSGLPIRSQNKLLMVV
jgi:hypothetical protein